ncbi:HipA family kinase [Bernardetia sp.]|uniref:HipA family kinase n=1 Tax=Bernardetia sp. TaxID=1937974 RepID=UPI0025C2CD62|nr:HipA family kinase [Bernardetia sp.]
MKIPIYEAIEFKKVLQEGGSTKPWLVEVSVSDSTETYVVKVFKKDTLNQYPAVANEVFANILAKELGLSVPPMALVNFSDTFITTLSNQEKELIEKDIIDSRVKFASLYLPNTQIYSLLSSGLDKYDRAEIYAFDNLIHNSDRKVIKPNLLLDINSEKYYLIDHELSICGIQGSYLTKIQRGEWLYNFKNHLFFHLQYDEKDIFAHFIESLRHISVNCLDKAHHELVKHGHRTPLDSFKPYLQHLKNNSHIFEKILYRQIRNE